MKQQSENKHLEKLCSATIEWGTRMVWIINDMLHMMNGVEKKWKVTYDATNEWKCIEKKTNICLSVPDKTQIFFRSLNFLRN